MDNEIRLVELFHQVSHKLRGMLADVFRNAGFSMSEIFVLVSLHKKKTSRVTDLAATIGIPTSTLTGIVDRLEAQGLLARSLDPDDRRSFLISETPKLKSVMDDWMTPLKTRLKGALRALPKDRIEGLLADLQALLEVLDRGRPAGH